jgi:nucleotide-binding universal stress UspA family protein
MDVKLTSERAGPRTILVAVDDSDTAMRALAWAAGIAQRTGAVLTVLHLPRASFSEISLAAVELAGVAAMPTPDVLGIHTRNRQRLIEAFAAIEQDGIRANLEVLHGRPVGGIVQATQRHRADMLVVGVTPPKFGRRSLPTRLVRKTTCPVTVVP